MTEQIIPIYSGKLEDFRWAGFGSGSGTNLRECAKVIKPALIFSDRPDAKLLRLEELAGVPNITIDGYKACGSWKQAQGNHAAEAEYQRKSFEYNQQILERLQTFEQMNGELHLIVLGGYMRMVGEPLLKAYLDKIINVHPADLSVLTESNQRLLIGEDAVHDALKHKYRSTRSSVIMVDEGIDHGEILTRGPGLNVWYEFIRGTEAERAECLRKYADAHQAMQKVRSDWPALTAALKMIAEGRIALGTEKTFHNEWRTVYVDGKPMGYRGFEFD